MKYLKSTTLKAYTINGKLVPANTSKDVLALEENEYFVISNKAAVASLIKAGGILVSDTDPRTGNAVANNKAAELQEKLTKAEEAQKEAEMRAKIKYQQLEQEAKTKIEELQAEIDKLKASGSSKKSVKSE